MAILKTLSKNFSLKILILAFIFISNCQTNSSENEGISLGYCAYDAITTEAINWYSQHAEFLIIHEWQKDKMKAIKAINPNIIIILYKISINKVDESHGAHGFEWINHNHQEWFLRDNNGNLMTDLDSEYSRENVYWLDWGNQGWRDYWCNSVLNDAISQGWDGVFMDCAFVDIKSYWAPNGILTYPTNASFNTAMEGFISNCYNQFQAKSKILVPNSADCVSYNGYWESRLAHSHGGLDEGFVTICQWAPEQMWRTEEEWERQIAALEYTGEQNKIYYAMTHNRGLNRQDTLYNVASYLIGKKNEKAFFYNAGVKGYYYNNYVKDYNTFQDIYNAPIGSPTGSRYKQDNVWQRDYSNGKVLVNPTSNSYTITLDRSYKKIDGKTVSSITLGEHEGIILLINTAPHIKIKGPITIDTTPPAKPKGLKIVP